MGKSMNSNNLKKREKRIHEYLKSLDIKDKNKEIIIQKENITFRFYMFQRNVDIFLSDCFQCLLDCKKSLEFYLENSRLQGPDQTDLEAEDILLLAQIKDILEDNFPFSSEEIQDRIKRTPHVLNFGLIGFDQVGKSTLFEMIPGKPKKVGQLLNTYTKEITSFPPLKVRLYDFGNVIIENLASNSPAPLLLERLKQFYLFIIVTDSSPQNITATKHSLLPKLKKVAPYAAFLVIANKQDLPSRLSIDLIEKILDARTYPLCAINPESKDFFNKLLNEVILLRQEQLQEFNCPFLQKNESI
jgi:hypothetical protein